MIVSSVCGSTSVISVKRHTVTSLISRMSVLSFSLPTARHLLLCQLEHHNSHKYGLHIKIPTNRTPRVHRIYTICKILNCYIKSYTEVQNVSSKIVICIRARSLHWLFNPINGYLHILEICIV